MMIRFGELCLKYGCDKERAHRYGDAYDLLLGRFMPPAPPPRILEIGIYQGASLKAWREYMPQAELWAFDIDPASVACSPEGVVALQGDQSDREFLASLAKRAGGFDIIIDDGSHRIDHQQLSFEVLWPFVPVHGIYVIEDLETSKCPRPRKWNPLGMESTLDVLLKLARDNVHWGRFRARPPMICFYRELCALVKME